MKVRRIFALAAQTEVNQVGECRTLATELDIPADEVENYVAECVAPSLSLKNK